MFDLSHKYKTVFQAHCYHENTSVSIVIALRSVYAGKKERIVL